MKELHGQLQTLLDEGEQVMFVTSKAKISSYWPGIYIRNIPLPLPVTDTIWTEKSRDYPPKSPTSALEIPAAEVTFTHPKWAFERISDCILHQCFPDLGYHIASIRLVPFKLLLIKSGTTFLPQHLHDPGTPKPAGFFGVVILELLSLRKGGRISIIGEDPHFYSYYRSTIASDSDGVSTKKFSWLAFYAGAEVTTTKIQSGCQTFFQSSCTLQ
eukprot:TRINITY_DN2183_c0_g1_i1.p1 TRINITY_DN2183_c0_g1~~TRINITY_DN2183_c0_g1_i1.p1  ORF type:complete len:214 (+),score=23.33 TRINITY_DN2183_c0_g1_i1:45-686(+)